jgi:hypothetical protein
VNLIEAYMCAEIGDEIGLGTQHTRSHIKIKTNSSNELKDYIDTLCNYELLDNSWSIKKKRITNIKKVTLEYRDWVFTIEGDEAVKWGNHNEMLMNQAKKNPFKDDPIKWQIFKLEGK